VITVDLNGSTSVINKTHSKCFADWHERNPYGAHIYRILFSSFFLVLFTSSIRVSGLDFNFSSLIFYAHGQPTLLQVLLCSASINIITGYYIFFADPKHINL